MSDTDTSGNGQATKQATAIAAIAERFHSIDIFADPASFEHAQRIAKVFASSDLVPQHMRGNIANCLLAYHMAKRLNEDPIQVMRNIYFVHGMPGWKTEYMIGRANNAGVFKGRITWRSEGKGDSLTVTATAVLAETGELIEATTSMHMAKAEGWTKNSKYVSMPEHMLRWRSASMLIRLYVPEVMFGMPTSEELETMPATNKQAMRDVTPKKDISQALDEFAAKNKPAEPATEAQNDPLQESFSNASTAEETSSTPTAEKPPSASTNQSAAHDQAAQSFGK